MVKQRSTILMVAIAATLIMAASAGATLRTGTKAPNFTLPTIDGKSFTLSDHAGKVVILDIWATTCPPCKAEIPYLVDAHKRLQGKGVVFVGVALDPSKDRVRTFIENAKVGYPIALDPGGAKVASDYKVASIPATYIIDKRGVIRAFHGGFPTSNRDAQKAAAAKIEKDATGLLTAK